MEVEKEIWRNISGYPGYQVSNIGRVKSMERNVKGKNDSIRTIRERIIKPFKNENGYLVVKLCNECKTKNMKVHRLVASAFVQNESLFNTEINHLDENKENNCASNLEWSDRQHNVNYGTRNERNSKTSINDPKKSKPVICLETGKIYPSTMEVKRQLGFSQGNISRCCNKKYRYKTVGGYHWKYVE